MIKQDMQAYLIQPSPIMSSIKKYTKVVMLKMLSSRPQGVGGVMIMVATSIYMQSMSFTNIEACLALK